MKITIATFQEMGVGSISVLHVKPRNAVSPQPVKSLLFTFCLKEGLPSAFFFSFLMKQIKPHSCNANLTHQSPPLPSSRFCSSEVDQAKMTLLNLQSKKLGFERENWPKADWKLVVKPVPKPRSPESLFFSSLSLS